MTESMEGRELRLPQHLSHSQVSAYGNCPRQYVLERGYKVPSRPSWALCGGSAIHSATEEFDRALHDGTEMDDNLLKETFDLALEAEIADREERDEVPRSEFRASGRASKQWPNKENFEWWQQNGRSMVLSWKTWRRTSPWQLLELPNLETGELEPAIEPVFTLDLGEGIIIKGAIDRVFQWQGTVIVTDLKTGREPIGASQLGTYGLALEDLWKVKAGAGTYWMSRTGACTNPVSLEPYTRERIMYDYQSARKGIDAGLFPAKVSNMCGSCSVRDYCYAIPNAAHAGEIPLAPPAPGKV